MRGEHVMSYDENSAFTGWRRFYHWRPGERKLLKARSHRKDRHHVKLEWHKWRT